MVKPSSHRPPLRLATRSSLLAKRQSEWVVERLRAICNREIAFHFVTSEGDRDRTTRLQDFSETGLFTRAVEETLLRGDADFAVHSLKDLPLESHPDLLLAAIPSREDPRDVLVPASGNSVSLEELPLNARVATSSPRRKALLRHWRPDAVVVPIRGNIDTRLKKVDSGTAEALVLAAAALNRLKTQRAFHPLPVSLFPPAPGQGALAVQCRRDDRKTVALLSRIDDPETRAAVLAERSILQSLGGGCHSATGIHLSHENEHWIVHAATLLDNRLRFFIHSEKRIDSLVHKVVENFT
ncbi:MAG: hydroxymethylbilane synthase [Candidatus Hydrogenedentota bacterium]|nr:MAG: hydroxymethylbilane synthase [Candidatus Hydrogenedentota bacterium]